jgi:hypothetical protein
MVAVRIAGCASAIAEEQDRATNPVPIARHLIHDRHVQDDRVRDTGAPGGLFFLAPGASFGSGANHSTIEIKGAISSLVSVPVPGTVLVKESGVQLLDGHHLTIHDNLMVHLRGGGSTIELAPATWTDGSLMADAVHLVTLAAAPPAAIQPHVGRSQSKWEGGSAVIPFAPDDLYNAATTYLLVDVWATRPDFNAPGRLPGPWPAARIASANDGHTALGVPAAWGFRRGTGPDCAFYFRCWYAEILDFGGAPFITVRPKRLFTKAELLTFTPRAMNYEIKGWRAGVTVVFGMYSFRLTTDEARLLAETVQKAVESHTEGLVPIIGANGRLGFQLPRGEAANVPGYLLSAIDYALGGSG